MNKIKWFSGVIIYYAIFIAIVAFMEPTHSINYIENLDAVPHFEPTLESGLTEWDCLFLEHQIDILNYRCVKFQGSIKEAETLKENILLELSVWDTRSSVHNTLKRLSEIEAERLRLTKLAQDEKDILENLNNLFKHCFKKI